MGEGYEGALDCDQVEIGAVGGVESGVYLSEGLCFGSGYFIGEGVVDTEDTCVVGGIVAVFEIRFYSVRYRNRH